MDDKMIVELFWNRTEKAIEETDIKYGKLCRCIATNILENDQDSEECINDTYLAAWNSMPDNRPKSLCSYICKITRNLALKKYEYNHAQKRNSNLELALDELENYLQKGRSVEEEFEAEQIGKIISKFLRSIKYRDRNIFLRRYWFLDSIKDISSLFKISESKVKSSLYRTRKRLKKYLLEEGVVL